MFSEQSTDGIHRHILGQFDDECIEVQGKVMLRFIQCPRNIDSGDGIALSTVGSGKFGMNVARILKKIEMTPRTVMVSDVPNWLIGLPHFAHENNARFRNLTYTSNCLASRLNSI